MALAIAGLLLLTVFSALRSAIVQQQFSVPSTYDYGRSGYASLYAFLAREGIAVDRDELPLSQLRGRRGTLVIAGDDALRALAPNAGDADAIDAWVRSGETVVILGTVSRHAPGMPALRDARIAAATASCGIDPHMRGLTALANFSQAAAAQCAAGRTTLLQSGRRAVAFAYTRGRGEVIVATTPQIFDNFHLAQRGNAALAYALLANHAPVAFEERIYGYAQGSGFWGVLPLGMRVAIVLAGAALLAAIAGGNAPFVPPFAAQAPRERDSGEYIASLARMLSAGGARELSARANHLQTIPEPRDEDVVDAGRLFARVQKEYP